ncbi:hypothetical protein M6B38_407065 [Iris pallida]|uniref:Uncharacterized protein n=1 Tax=Iris pallida TaxID=29817 RepID=A0AAX6FPT2_IRIPA|nr:hypothetical protein M6B38_407065 [Iris pallida]
MVPATPATPATGGLSPSSDSFSNDVASSSTHPSATPIVSISLAMEVQSSSRA